MTTSTSLSTNLTHWVALDAGARLAASSDDARAARRYRGWADGLARAIRATFWRADARQFSHVLPSELDPTPVKRHDALATALAVLTGVATPAQARAAVANYPQTTFGPPVVWPQQQDVPGYHNNGIWPFVTAYVLRAAARTGNDAVATASATSLLRGAALHGSHMENINLLDGGIKTEMNSKRQLWSVGGMQSMVQQTLFGLDARPDGLRVAPFVPAHVARQLGLGRTLRLEGMVYRGKALDVSLEVPATGSAGAYAVESVSLDGRRLARGAAITESMLSGSPSRITVRLGAAGRPASPVRMVERTKKEALYGPKTPTVTALEPAGRAGVRLRVDLGEEAPGAVSMSVYRDGRTVARDIPPRRRGPTRGPAPTAPRPATPSPSGTARVGQPRRTRGSAASGAPAASG